MVILKHSRNVVYSECEGNIEESVEQDEKIYNEE